LALFNPSRNEVRQFFFNAWSKFKQQQALSDLEAMAIEIIQMHPEYHPVLAAPERYLEQEYFPQMGETNPFLHMSLHLSVLEQIRINQPPGIMQIYQSLLRNGASPMDAQHDVMDCLAETIWQAQRAGQQPDTEAYLNCMRNKASMNMKSINGDAIEK
jgi:hypothetical protein